MSSRLLSFSHRSGATVDLPLLVPSFSSKGFAFSRVRKGRREHIYSETAEALETLGAFMNESMLLSAYDLHHHHFRSPEKNFRNTSLVLLDSGGYELTPDFDSSEPRLTETMTRPFTAEDYRALLARLQKKHRDHPLVITNFDWDSRHTPYPVQIEAARTLFNRFRHWSNNFIVKPPSRSRTVVDIDELLPHFGDLRSFDMLGVTEKELGKNLLDRLKRIARLRCEMLRKDVNIPIHVWGGLDPVVTPLYFFAGADIFDGVSWLRYAFHQGMAVNREASPVLAGDLTVFHDHAVGLALNHNLTALQGLATSLRAFAVAESPNFEMFDHNRDVFEKAFRVMTAKIAELRELY